MSHRITFRERGSGAPLLLLHGYGGTVHHWEGVASRLEGHFRLIIPNLTHLFLGRDKLFFSVQVEALAKFIQDQFPGEKVHVAGLSYGGALTWALAAQHPELIEKVILINPMVTEPIKHFLPKEMKFFLSMPMNITSIYLLLATPMGRSFLRRSAEIFRDERSNGPASVEKLTGRKLQFVAHMIHNFAWILRSEDWSLWSKKLSTYRGSCRMLFCVNDLLFNPDVYTKFAMHIGCEEVIVLNDAGHLAIKSQPDAVAKSIIEFVQSKKVA